MPTWERLQGRVWKTAVLRWDSDAIKAALTALQSQGWGADRHRRTDLWGSTSRPAQHQEGMGELALNARIRRVHSSEFSSLLLLALLGSWMRCHSVQLRCGGPAHASAPRCLVQFKRPSLSGLAWLPALTSTVQTHLCHLQKAQQA